MPTISTYNRAVGVFVDSWERSLRKGVLGPRLIMYGALLAQSDEFRDSPLVLGFRVSRAVFSQQRSPYCADDIRNAMRGSWPDVF